MSVFNSFCPFDSVCLIVFLIDPLWVIFGEDFAIDGYFIAKKSSLWRAAWH